MKTLGLALLNIRYFSFYFLLWLCTLTLHGVVVYIALPFAIIPTSSSSFTSLLFLKFIWAPVVHQTIDEFLRFSLAYIHYLFASNYNLIQYFLFAFISISFFNVFHFICLLRQFYCFGSLLEVANIWQSRATKRSLALILTFKFDLFANFFDLRAGSLAHWGRRNCELAQHKSNFLKWKEFGRWKKIWMLLKLKQTHICSKNFFNCSSA